MVRLSLLLLLLQAKPAPPPKDESVLVKVAENAQLPSVALDPDGNPAVAFIRNGNIEVTVSGDGGKTFPAPVTALSGGGKLIAIPNRGPRIAIDRQKRIYVAAPLCLGPAGGPTVNDLYFAVSTDHGKSFGKATMINETAGTAGDSAFAIAAGTGDLHAVWVDAKSGKGRSLLYARLDISAKRPGKVVTITGLCCENCPPGIAVDQAGNIAVAWREGGGKPTRQIYLSRSTDAGKSFAPPVQLNSLDSGLTECPQDPPAAAATPDGKMLAAAWMERRDVEGDADIFWAYGPPGKFRPDVCCQDDRRFQQRRPTLAIDGEGTVWCAWEDSRLSVLHVFYTHHKMDRNIAVGDPRTEPSQAPSLASGAGKVVLAYQLRDSVALRVLATK